MSNIVSSNKPEVSHFYQRLFPTSILFLSFKTNISRLVLRCWVQVDQQRAGDVRGWSEVISHSNILNGIVPGLASLWPSLCQGIIVCHTTEHPTKNVFNCRVELAQVWSVACVETRALANIMASWLVMDARDSSRDQSGEGWSTGIQCSSIPFSITATLY